MRSFTESGLRFTFNKDWVVKKYDSHRYYKGLSGMGLKGIDFIALNLKENLVAFFEVKNYRTRFHQNTGEPIYPEPKPAHQLAQALSDKVSDTLLAIDAITTYYRKSLLYRWLQPLYLRLPFYIGDRFFWTKVENCIYQHENLAYVLWVELQEKDLHYQDQLKQQTDLLLKNEFGVIYVADMADQPFPQSLAVHPAS
ncbi:MAG: hypothetical protein KTR30_10390 [Saprospiraceae bacterium]|nr:hypothetical protein [Saprospiraceae bacterium]